MGFLTSLFRGKNENAALLRTMHELALSDTPEKRRKLYEVMLGSTLLVPVKTIPAGLKPGQQTTTSDTRIPLIGMRDQNGILITPTFTDEEALRNWDPSSASAGFNARELFQMVLGTDLQVVVINPFDPKRKMIRPGGRVTRAEIELLARGLIPGRFGSKGIQFQLKAKDKLKIASPTNPLNSTVEDELRVRSETFAEVDALYFVHMGTETGSSHAVIGIVANTTLSKERREEIADDLGKAIQSKLNPDQSLDFMFLSGDTEEQVKKFGKQIFRRETFRK